MTDLSSKMDRAEQLAARHAKLGKMAAKLATKRNNCLYRLLEEVHEIGVDVSQLPEQDALALFQAKYGNEACVDYSDFFQRIYPELPPKYRWKYTGVLHKASAEKIASQSMKQFVKKNGGLNGCVTKKDVTKKKKSRQAQKRRQRRN
jgi:hypothetical protein